MVHYHHLLLLGPTFLVSTLVKILLKTPVLSIMYIFLNVLYGVMALAKCVFVDLCVDVLE